KAQVFATLLELQVEALGGDVPVLLAQVGEDRLTGTAVSQPLLLEDSPGVRLAPAAESGRGRCDRGALRRHTWTSSSKGTIACRNASDLCFALDPSVAFEAAGRSLAQPPMRSATAARSSTSSCSVTFMRARTASLTSRPSTTWTRPSLIVTGYE